MRMNERLVHNPETSDEIPRGGDTVGITADPHFMRYDPNEVLPNARAMLGSYFTFWKMFTFMNPFVLEVIQHAEDMLKNTTELSTRSIAEHMRQVSEDCWRHSRDTDLSIPIQTTFNNRLLTHASDGTLNIIKSDQLTPLFEQGKEASWPHLILTSNHARACETKDLHELMQGVCRIASDAWGKALDICRLTTETKPEYAATKNIVIMACHTEKDNLLNGANLIDRRLDLDEDVNKECPKDRTLQHISPAAVRLAKLMIKLMVEPESQTKVDLGRSQSDTDIPLNNRPFVSDDLLDKNVTEPIILRSDAKKIAGHIKLIGYSKGANTVTDALRFFYQECAHLGRQLQVRGEKGELRVADNNDIRNIISGIALLNIAPGEVPLTKAEKEVLGIKRTSILNTHDITAGHLVNPKSKDYDKVQDKLIKIVGTKNESGHSVTDALGNDEKSGYIMALENGVTDEMQSKKANDNARNYRNAQESIREFFASNHCNKIHPTTHVTGVKEIESLGVGLRSRA